MLGVGVGGPIGSETEAVSTAETRERARGDGQPTIGLTERET